MRSSFEGMRDQNLGRKYVSPCKAGGFGVRTARSGCKSSVGIGIAIAAGYRVMEADRASRLRFRWLLSGGSSLKFKDKDTRNISLWTTGIVERLPVPGRSGECRRANSSKRGRRSNRILRQAVRMSGGVRNKDTQELRFAGCNHHFAHGGPDFG